MTRAGGGIYFGEPHDQEDEEPEAPPGGVREPRRPKPSPRQGGAAAEPEPAAEDLRLIAL